ncbi:NAD(P)-dependent oxidoreductase [Agrobacterium rhizogenes]|nr:NAD(P)-dependent oxidoreductase [Rhizobium rhizogenes]
MRLDGKVAIVTGAARGVGRACAVHFAREGAQLILIDVADNIDGVPYALGTRSQLDCTEELCRVEGVPAWSLQVDVRNLRAIHQAIEFTLDHCGRIDVLLNNAGIAAPSGKAVHETTEAEWLLMLDIDLSGTWRMIHAAAKSMLECKSGSIINISSTAGLVGYRNFAAYVAAKHGIIGLTRAAALDFAPLKVRVNAICPGSIRDEAKYEGCMLGEIARALSVPVSEHEETFVQGQPMNALIEPEDVALAAVWLASDEARQVTGAVIAVDGGYSAR